MRSKLLTILLFCALSVSAQRIPEMIEYTEVYDFIEELTTDGVIETNAAIKPYTRDYIAARLREAQAKDSLLNKISAGLCLGTRHAAYVLQLRSSACDAVEDGGVEPQSGGPESAYSDERQDLQNASAADLRHGP